MTSGLSKLALHGGGPVRTKPFPRWPQFGPEDEQALTEVVRSGNWWCPSFAQGRELTGGTSQVVDFQQAFAELHHSRLGIATSSGTAALDACVRHFEFEIGSEVIVPAYSYVASATCALQSNLVPIFVDIDANTYNIDPARVEAAITDRTRAIVPVHFGGQMADMDGIMRIAEKHGLKVIEDAAHAHGSAWNKKPAGSIGDVGVFSFQGSKNMTAGEGGMIITSDDATAAGIESLVWGGRLPGTPWYEVHRLGWNSRMTEFQAALLMVQLGRLQAQNLHRDRMAKYLTSLIDGIEGISPLRKDARATTDGCHLYVLRYDESLTDISRAMFLEALQAEGIPAFAGYEHPLYRNPLFREQSFVSGSFPMQTRYHPGLRYEAFVELCPVSERACATEAIWLTHNVLLGDETDMDDIAAAISKVLSV